MKHIIIVANRLPVTVSVSDPETPDGGPRVALTHSSGGLVSGLEPLRARAGTQVTWVGWPGPLARDTPAVRAAVAAALAPHSLVPVFLDAALAERHYEGYSNTVLWPLLHTLPQTTVPPALAGRRLSQPRVRPVAPHTPGRDTAWGAYVHANRLFAAAAAAQLARIGPASWHNTLVWFHDYHLFLAPQFLREILSASGCGDVPTAATTVAATTADTTTTANTGIPVSKTTAAATPCFAFFLHVPFPPPEVFRMLPTHKQLLAGLLSCDLVGLHTHEFSAALLACAQTLAGYPVTLNRVTVPQQPLQPRRFSVPSHNFSQQQPQQQQQQLAQRVVTVGTFPLGIDARAFAAASEKPWSAVLQRTRTLLRRLFAPEQEERGTVVLSVSRLDYTKGIRHTLFAFDELLAADPALRGTVALVLVVVPSREGVERYRVLKQEVEHLVGLVNGKHATLAWTPVRYLYRGLAGPELRALYAASDVALICPLRDGMNLCAKEYVAAHAHPCPTRSGTGVLVLSSMAGAAKELLDAVVVNPYEVADIAQGLRTAVAMAPAEQQQRMDALVAHVLKNNTETWTNAILQACNDVMSASARLVPAQPLNPQQVRRLADTFRLAKHPLLVLDYDGTLVPFHANPQKALPDDSLSSTLRRLASRPECSVVIISGRDRAFLEKHLGTLPNVMLVAEHGAWYWDTGRSEWTSTVMPSSNNEWKHEVRKLFAETAALIPGCFIEEKTFGMAFHYRAAVESAPNAEARQRILNCTTDLLGVVRNLIKGLPLKVTAAKMAVEVSSTSVSKGGFLQARFLQSSNNNKFDFVLAAGDDTTDEDMFISVNECLKHNPNLSAATIHIGTGSTHARSCVASVSEFRGVLNALCETLPPDSSNEE